MSNPSLDNLRQNLKDYEDYVSYLENENDKLRKEVERLRNRLKKQNQINHE